MLTCLGIEGVPLGHDFFLVLQGAITIKMRDGDVRLGAGEPPTAPKGVEHGPVAKEAAHILLIEPTGTANTGPEGTAAARVLVYGVRTFSQCLLPKQGKNGRAPNLR